MRGQENLLGRAIADGFFQHGRAAGAQQFEAGILALAQLRSHGRGGGHLQQRGGGFVHQQELALLVLNRHAGRKQSEDIPQDAQFGIESAFIAGLRRGRLKIIFLRTVHGREAWQSPL